MGVKKYFFLSSALLIGCQADQGTKYWAITQLREQRSLEVIPSLFELSYVENAGVAFGIMDQLDDPIRIPLIIVLPLLATSIIGFVIWKWRKNSTRMLMPLVLVLSGAIGNILDRINYGYVIDFFHIHYRYAYSLPVFNIADMLVFIGGIWFMYLLWKDETPFSVWKNGEMEY